MKLWKTFRHNNSNMLIGIERTGGGRGINQHCINEAKNIYNG